MFLKGIKQIEIVENIKDFFIVFQATFLSAFWIGNLIAAILRAKFGKTARGKDIGKALALIIALSLVALVFGIQFGGILEVLSDPNASGNIKVTLSLLPSSWGAEVIVGFASNPGNIAAFVFETLTRFGSLVFFFVAVLFLGTKAANHAYSLEPTTFTGSRAKPDGAFYKTVKHLGGGGSFGTPLVSIFKDYSRRFENLSKIAYIVGLIAMMNVFIIGPQLSEQYELGLILPLMMIQFMLPILAVFVAGEVTLRGKEALFIYRKTPSGVVRFIKARLIQGWLIVVPIAAAVTVLSTSLSPQTTLISLFINTGLGALIAAGNVTIVLGLFLLIPAFSEKSVSFTLNVLIVMFISIGLFLVPLFGLMRIIPNLDLIVRLLYVLLSQTALGWSVGIVLLFLGSKKPEKNRISKDGIRLRAQ